MTRSAARALEVRAVPGADPRTDEPGLWERINGFLNELSSERVLISAQERGDRIAEYCSQALLSSTTDVQIAVASIIIFLERLNAIRAVQAVAFLAMTYPDAATTLVVDIVVDREQGSETRAALTKRITDAHADLMKQLQPILPTGLQFVNMTKEGLDSVEAKLRARWTQSTDTRVLGFGVFDRT